MSDLTMPDWAPPIPGPWCLKQWLPLSQGPVGAYVICLMSPDHEGDCRDQFGAYHNPQISMLLGQLENPPVPSAPTTSVGIRNVSNDGP